MSLENLTTLKLSEVVGLSNRASDPHHEPRNWLRFEDVAHCRDAELFNAFVGQYLSERGLAGECRKRTYWALFYAWNNGISSSE
jgi:hypothetical protein